MVSSKPELNGLAKKAYKSYLRSVYLMPNKEIFQVDQLPLEEFATSLIVEIFESIEDQG